MLQVTSDDRNLVCISPINWDEVWEGPQEISSRFAAAGWRVLFVENIGARVPRFTWHDARRIGARVNRLLTKKPPAAAIPAGVNVHTPFSFPAYKSRLLHKQNRSMLIQQIGSRLNHLGMKRPVIWTYNPSAFMREVCESLNPRLLIYCCVHDFSRISPKHAHLAEDERQMMDAADLVFVLSRQLLAEKQSSRQNVFLLPQSANLQHYLTASLQRTELAGLPRPVVGYIGTIHEWVDQELLKFAAQAKPGWTFVLIGPERVGTAELRKLRNVLFLGPKDHALLPSYVAEFNVGIIPYVTNAFAQTIRPNKVLEYLVMGKPVITTRLPELDAFRNHLLSTDSPQQFVQAIELAIDTDSPTKQTERREVAIANSMDRKFADIESLVLARLSNSELASRQYQKA